MKKGIKNVVVGVMVPSLLVLGGCGSKGSEKTTSAAPSKQSSTASAGIQERTIKAGVSNGKAMPLGQGLDKFAELVSQKSNGKIKVQNYFDSTLGDEKKQASSLQAGTQDVTVISTSPLVGTVKELGVFDIPFSFNNEKEADSVLDGPVGSKVLEKLTAHNLVGLAYWENGFRNATNSKHPILTVDDFKGLKMRTMQNPIHLEVFKKYGANPTPMPITEVFSALESKAIDGQENPVQVIQDNKMQEVQKYLSLTKHVYTPYVFLVSKKLWDQFSDEEKKIFKDSALEAGKFQREAIRASTGKIIEQLKKDGMVVNDVSPEARAKMQETAKPVVDQFSKEMDQDLVKEFFAELQKARK
jgi:tripartite ATP-independent transporter DctP family solute receptor